MEYTTIGQNIARLRREKETRQEELANYVGVSAQAVSKWENGGMPDPDLLPKIADYFNTSIDALFGRYTASTIDLWKNFDETINPENALEKGFEICSLVISTIRQKFPEEALEKFTLSESMTQSDGIGFAKLYNSRTLSYFMLSPNDTEAGSHLYGGKDYPALFRDLADEKFFAALAFLMSRESDKSFTSNLLTKKLGFIPEETAAVIEKLMKYTVLSATTAEIDDEETTVYKTKHNHSLTALLTIANELPGIKNK